MSDCPDRHRDFEVIFGAHFEIYVSACRPAGLAGST